MSTDACPLCGTPTCNLRPWLNVPVDVKKCTSTAFGELVWCETCDLGTMLQKPDAQALSEAYDLRRYYTHGGSHMPQVDSTPADRILLKAAYLCDHGRHMDGRMLLAQVPIARSVLDIGCGSGDFLSGFVGEGRRLLGVEPDPNARKVASERGLEVLPGAAEDLSDALSGRSFDLITLTHVLEHCRDPLQALISIRAHLSPTGVLYCEVPNSGSIYFKTFARISEMLDVPRHLHFFTKASLIRLSERAGLRITGWNHHGYTRHFGPSWRAWENEIHTMLAERGATGTTPRRSWLNSLALLARSALARPDQKYDCIGVYARTD